METITPKQLRSPVALIIVHPVLPTPPANSTLPEEKLLIWAIPVVPASRIRLLESPAEMDPIPAKVSGWSNCNGIQRGDSG